MIGTCINLYTLNVLWFKLVLMCGILPLSAIIVLYIAFPVTLLKWLDRLLLFLHGLKSKGIQVGGNVFSYSECGFRSNTRTTYLMIHGLSASKNLWSPVIAWLPWGSHCVSVDLPGHGGTPAIDDVTMEGQADEIHKLVKALGLQDFHILGSSYGGQLAGVYTARYPEHVKLLTLAGPIMMTPKLTNFQEELREGKCCIIAETATEVRKMMSLVAHFPIYFPPGAEEALAERRKPRYTYFRKIVSEMGGEKGMGIMETLAPSLHQPTQLVWGEYDQMIHVSGADFLQQKLRNCRRSRVDILQKCGHVPMFDCPRKFAKVVGLFRQENNVSP